MRTELTADSLYYEKKRLYLEVSREVRCDARCCAVRGLGEVQCDARCCAMRGAGARCHASALRCENTLERSTCKLSSLPIKNSCYTKLTVLNNFNGMDLLEIKR